MINKNRYRITNNKKKLIKVGKRWVVASLFALALLGGTAVVSHASVTTPSVQPTASKQVQPKVQQNAGQHIETQGAQLSKQVMGNQRPVASARPNLTAQAPKSTQSSTTGNQVKQPVQNDNQSNNNALAYTKNVNVPEQQFINNNTGVDKNNGSIKILYTKSNNGTSYSGVRFNQMPKQYQPQNMPNSKQYDYKLTGIYKNYSGENVSANWQGLDGYNISIPVKAQFGNELKRFTPENIDGYIFRPQDNNYNPYHTQTNSDGYEWGGNGATAQTNPNLDSANGGDKDITDNGWHNNLNIYLNYMAYGDSIRYSYNGNEFAPVVKTMSNDKNTGDFTGDYDKYVANFYNDAKNGHFDNVPNGLYVTPSDAKSFINSVNTSFQYGRNNEVIPLHKASKVIINYIKYNQMPGFLNQSAGKNDDVVKTVDSKPGRVGDAFNYDINANAPKGYAVQNGYAGQNYPSINQYTASDQIINVPIMNTGKNTVTYTLNGKPIATYESDGFTNSDDSNLNSLISNDVIGGNFFTGNINTNSMRRDLKLPYGYSIKGNVNPIALSNVSYNYGNAHIVFPVQRDNGTVTVHYVDNATGKQISSDDNTKGYVLSKFNLTKPDVKNIDGYQYAGINSDNNVNQYKYNKQDITLGYIKLNHPNNGHGDIDVFYQKNNHLTLYRDFGNYPAGTGFSLRALENDGFGVVQGKHVKKFNNGVQSVVLTSADGKDHTQIPDDKNLIHEFHNTITYSLLNFKIPQLTWKSNSNPSDYLTNVWTQFDSDIDNDTPVMPYGWNSQRFYISKRNAKKAVKAILKYLNGKSISRYQGFNYNIPLSAYKSKIRVEYADEDQATDNPGTESDADGYELVGGYTTKQPYYTQFSLKDKVPDANYDYFNHNAWDTVGDVGYTYDKILSGNNVNQYLPHQEQVIIIGLNEVPHTIKVNYIDAKTNKVISSAKPVTQPRTYSFDISPYYSEIPSGYEYTGMKNDVSDFSKDATVDMYVIKPSAKVAQSTISINYIDKNTNKVIGSSNDTQNVSTDYDVGQHLNIPSNYSYVGMNNSGIDHFDYDNHTIKVFVAKKPNPQVAKSTITVAYVDTKTNKVISSSKDTQNVSTDYDLGQHLNIPAGYEYAGVRDGVDDFGYNDHTIKVLVNEVNPAKLTVSTITINYKYGNKVIGSKQVSRPVSTNFDIGNYLDVPNGYEFKNISHDIDNFDYDNHTVDVNLTKVPSRKVAKSTITVNYVNNGKVIKSVKDTQPVSTDFDVDEYLSNLPSGFEYQGIKNDTDDFHYGDQTVDVELHKAPNAKVATSTININYVDKKSGKVISSSKTTEPVSTDYDVGSNLSIPSGYEYVGMKNDTNDYKYTDQTVNVYVSKPSQPKVAQSTITVDYKDGNKVIKSVQVTKPVSSNFDVDEYLSNLPQGYEYKGIHNDTDDFHYNDQTVDVLLNKEPNPKVAKSTITVDYVNNGKVIKSVKDTEPVSTDFNIYDYLSNLPSGYEYSGVKGSLDNFDYDDHTVDIELNKMPTPKLFKSTITVNYIDKNSGKVIKSVKDTQPVSTDFDTTSYLSNLPTNYEYDGLNGTTDHFKYNDQTVNIYLVAVPKRNPVKPVQPNQPNNPVTPAKPNEPVKPSHHTNKPVAPKHHKNNRPVKPVRPNKPSKKVVPSHKAKHDNLAPKKQTVSNHKVASASQKAVSNKVSAKQSAVARKGQSNKVLPQTNENHTSLIWLLLALCASMFGLDTDIEKKHNN